MKKIFLASLLCIAFASCTKNMEDMETLAPSESAIEENSAKCPKGEHWHIPTRGLDGYCCKEKHWWVP